MTKEEFVERYRQLESERKKRKKHASKDTERFFQDRYRERRSRWAREKRKS